jgi:uncharacterized protein (UPF0332 family)
MSPRSAEFLEAAKRRLAVARGAIGEDPASALSAAYYSMLYAARAALSEHDVYAKTHAGTWHELRRVFVEPGLLDAELVADAQNTQPKRERADYEAWPASEEEAQRVIDLAATFLAAVNSVIDPSPPTDAT